MSYVSIKIRAATQRRLRLLSAHTGKRITMLIDEWATAEMARLGVIDAQTDTPSTDRASEKREGLGLQ